MRGVIRRVSLKGMPARMDWPYHEIYEFFERNRILREYARESMSPWGRYTDWCFGAFPAPYMGA